MAAPNLKALLTVNGKSALLAATTSETDLISAVATGHLIVVEPIYVTNIHATAAGKITVIHSRGTGGEWRYARNKTVGIRTTINALLGKPAYLEEGDSLVVQADANSVLE